jgi:hypothetical protein
MIGGLTTSQLAAQAAMHAQSSQHNRKRSQTLPDPTANPSVGPAPNARWNAPPTQHPLPDRSFNVPSNPNLRNVDGFLGGHSLAAAAAAFPRSPQYSPAPVDRGPPVPEKDMKPGKEKSKMKLFSKPKSIGIYKDKDIDRKHPPMPSPGKMSLYGPSTLKLAANASTTSLVDPTMSSGASMYSSANTSTSTLVPGDRALAYDKEKEKHKHHFLSRQKNKLRDKEDFHLPLSSASSTSKPTDPNAPQPLYSFAPSSPANPSAFAKSVSGLDLRHGGRALREKKKEEKAASSLSTTTLLGPASSREREASFSSAAAEWPGTGNFASSNTLLPAPSIPTAIEYALSPAGLADLGTSFGVSGITADDAWPLVKAKLLNIFEGEDPRPPIEDFNSLVSIHLYLCIQRRAPTVIIEDFTELLQTGFYSLDQSLSHIPDERLVPHLVEMWIFVFNTILPFMQAVFLPVDLEFKGRGPLMTAREAADFWGAKLPDVNDHASDAGMSAPLVGEDLEVRRITLQTFRDIIFLPRFDTLMAIFSRLSLESINAGVPDEPLPPLAPPPPLSDGTRPGTASSTDAALNSLTSPASFVSQGGALLDGTNSTASPSPFSILSSASRSRATSNTSAGSWHSTPSAHQPGHLTPLQQVSSVSSQTAMPTPPFTNGHQGPNGNFYAAAAAAHAHQVVLDTGARVTEIVGRMLQCVSVLASVQSADEAQASMERLTKTLKWNWLGRGRTGRQRRGFVGTRIRTGGGSGSGRKEVEVTG